MGTAQQPRIRHQSLNEAGPSAGEAFPGDELPIQRCASVRMPRRDALRWGALSLLGLGLPTWLAPARVAAASGTARARRSVLIWLDGGPSHLDTFDPKPDAPVEVRGPFASAATEVPGIRLSELLPRTAQLISRLAIVRSVTSPLGEHNLGSHYLLTGYKPNPALQYPSYGAMLAHLKAPAELPLPPYVAVPDFNAAAGSGYLPVNCRPFALGGDPSQPDFRVRDVQAYAGLDDVRLGRRRNMVRAFDQLSAVLDQRAPAADSLLEQAYRLIASPAARDALDLSKETPEVRQRYGMRRLGQSCLLARRLLEAEVPFVTVTDRGWDTHENLVNRLREGYTGGHVGAVPLLDQAYSALLTDLDQRGMLDETLVILMGEFGRTPKINTMGGRDHWPRVFSVVLAGAGIPGGQTIGSSDDVGESPRDRPILPEQLACTFYTILGIDPDHILHTADGRPVHVSRGGDVIKELVG